jgi:hypothetical protein
MIKNPAKGFCYRDLDVRVCVLVVDGSLDLAARAERLQAFLFDEAIQGTARDFTVQWQMHRTRDAGVFGCHSFVRRVEIYRVASDFRTCWRAVSNEAFALYVIFAGVGVRRSYFPSVRISVRAVALCASR